MQDKKVYVGNSGKGTCNWGKPDPFDPPNVIPIGWARVIVMEESPEGLLVNLPYDTKSDASPFCVEPDIVDYNPV